MFSCVWLYFKKFSEKYFLVFGKEEGKDKPSKTRTKPRKNLKKKSSTRLARDWVRRRGALQAPVRRSRQRSRSTARSHEGEIAIFKRSQSTSRDRDRRRDLAKARRSRSTARSCEASITISDCGRRTGAHEIGADWSLGFTGDHRTGLELGHQRSRACSLSLSLSFSGNTLKGK